MKKFGIYLIVSLAAVGLIVWLAISQEEKNTKYKVGQSPENLDSIGEVFENQGQEHIKIGAQHPPYNSNPPTSGWHYSKPANWGVYSRPLDDEQAVHNLEHGGIWITYKDIDEATKESLERIAKANRQSVIMSPRDANDAKIVLASWTRLLKLDSYDEEKILDFILRNKSRGPEDIVK